jgi:hypothetical protein
MQLSRSSILEVHLARAAGPYILAPLGSGDQSEVGLLSGVKLTRCEHYWDDRCSSAYAHGIFNRQFEPQISQIVL